MTKALLLLVPMLGLTGTVSTVPGESAETRSTPAGWEQLLHAADSLATANRPDSAISVAALAVQEMETAPAVSDSARAHAIHRLGYYHYAAGDYAGAETPWRRSLEIRERSLSPGHPDLARSLNNLGLLLYVLGRYGEAEPYMRRGIKTLEDGQPEEPLDIARSLTNLGNLRSRMNAYADAESILTRALGMFEKAEGPENPDVATCLNSLGGIYHRQGRLDEAEHAYRRALALWEGALGSDHPHVAFVVQNLGLVLKDQGRLEEAEPLLTRALGTLQKALGPDHPDLGPALQNLGNLYVAQGRYEEAEPLLARAAAIHRKAYGTGHPFYAAALFAQAVLWERRGRFARAESLADSSLSIRETVLGEDDPDVAEVLELLSRAYRARGLHERALAAARRACGIRQRNLVEGAITLSEEDALTYAASARASSGNYLGCFFDLERPGERTVNEALKVIFAAKGPVSDIVFERRKAARALGGKAAVGLIDALRATKARLSQLFVQGPGDDLPGYRTRRDSLAAQAKAQEAALSRRTGLVPAVPMSKLTSERVASLLPPRSALVEYMRYEIPPVADGDSAAGYVAAVVTADGRSAIRDLGPAGNIDSLVDSFRRQMSRVSMERMTATAADEAAYRDLGRRLTEAVWDPVKDLGGDTDLVLIAPDGMLNLLSFAALVMDDGTYLVERTAVHYITSARDLFRLARRHEEGTGLLALGDPDYDATASGSGGALPASGRPPGLEAGAAGLLRSSCSGLRNLLLDRLPESGTEVREIAADWRKTTGEPAVVLVDAEASEDRFKREAPGSRVIHLATHGYFLSADCATRGKKTGLAGEHPLLLSGLLLAGANHQGEAGANAGGEDGILTAYEVSAMALEGTDLVVLSGCETGLGELRVGEGVYGLRRAFQMAGARTVVSALWPVSDTDTALLMSRLYERGEGGLAEKMREFQLSRLAALRKEGHPTHPAGWGAFVVVGDWRQ